MFPLTRVPFWYWYFEPYPNLEAVSDSEEPWQVAVQVVTPAWTTAEHLTKWEEENGMIASRPVLSAWLVRFET